MRAGLARHTVLALWALWALQALTACQTPPVYAPGECREGAMDGRFCDRDGDLVADAPREAARWLDPDVLIFAYTPVEDPTQYREVWTGFLAHMQAVVGRPVQFFPVQSNAAQIEAMRAGRLHLAGFNTGSMALAVNCAGFRPVAMMAAADGSYGYEMEIITLATSPIKGIEDLRGRKIAFTSPTSNSGYKAPLALLRSQFGMEPERDYRPAFSGRHDNSILGVLNGDYEAAAIANEVSRRLVAIGQLDPTRVRTIYTSATFPTTGFGHAHNLHPDLARRVREAFLAFPWKDSTLAREFPNQDGFIPVDYASSWTVVREIDQALGVTYSCR